MKTRLSLLAAMSAVASLAVSPAVTRAASPIGAFDDHADVGAPKIAGSVTLR
jgi:hypothetical protein